MPYKPTSAVKERMDAKRDHILNTSIKVFTTKGYNNTTMKDLIDAAGISVGSFYFYFKSKAQLFEILYDKMSGLLFKVLKNIFKDYDQDISKRFCMGITTTLMTFQYNHELARIMMVEAVGLNPVFEKKRTEATRMFVDFSAEEMRKLIKLGKLEDMDVEVVSMAFIGTIYNVTLEWFSQASERKLTDCAYPLIKYNLQAFKIDFNENEIKEYINEALKQNCCFCGEE